MKTLCPLILSLACAVPTLVLAQSRDDLQPGVNTSAMPTQAPASAPESARARAMREKVEAALAAADGTPAGAPAPAPEPPIAASADEPAAAQPAKAARTAKATKASKTGKASDRIDLDTTQITGNKELPKVMYVVPWKHADLGDLTGKPPNSLVDEILQPVDRDVFNREQRYYHTVAPQKSPPAPPTGAPADH